MTYAPIAPRAVRSRKERSRSIGRAVLAACQTWEAALRAGRDGAGAAGVRRAPAAPRRRPRTCAGLRLDPHGTQAPQACDAAALVGGVSRRSTAQRRYGTARFASATGTGRSGCKRSMRQRHFAGEKLFVDYAGRTVPIYGAGGEEAFRAQLFVGALGRERLCVCGGDAHARRCRTGSAVTCGCWSFMGRVPPSSCPTTRGSA